MRVRVRVRVRHRVAEAAELDVTAELRALALELTGLVRGVARLYDGRNVLSVRVRAVGLGYDRRGEGNVVRQPAKPLDLASTASVGLVYWCRSSGTTTVAYY